MIHQLTQCMFNICIAIYISFDSINDSIISDTALDYIITDPGLFSGSTINYEVKPFFVIGIKSSYFTICRC